jgi:chromosome segregation ATPase
VTPGGEIHRGGNGEAPTRSPQSVYDWDRLERAVRALVEKTESLQQQLQTLRDDAGKREARIRSLEVQILDANQRRQDTTKRLDELIAQLDQLDAQLDSAEPQA